MYKKILVPVDGSPTSIRGLQEAIKLAKNQGAALQLIHVVDELLLDSPYFPGIDHEVYRQSRREGGQRLLSQMQAIAREHGIEADGLLRETVGGRAADLIVEAARSWPADLIVMGTHGRRGVQRLLMGSDAGVVVHLAPVPVLLVRAPAADSALSGSRKVA